MDRPLRIVFGPAALRVSAELLAETRRDHECLALGAELAVERAGTWAEVASQFPAHWHPDLVLVALNEPRLPDGVWRAPVPVLGAAPDWDLHAHLYRHLAPRCDAVVVEEPDAPLAAPWCEQVLRVDLDRPDRSALEPRDRPTERDIDVLVLDPLDPACRAERLRWVGRVSQLAAHCRVVVRPSTTPDGDREWLDRAKVVVQLPGPGGNRLAFEALAAGAALVRMPTIGDGGDRLRPGLDYQPYSHWSLESQVLGLLGREADRRRIADSGAARVRELTPSRLNAALSAADVGRLTTSVERRTFQPDPIGSGHRVWVAVAGGPPTPAVLVGPDTEPERAVTRGLFATDPAAAADDFRRGLALDPNHPVAGANLAAALALAGRTDEAVSAARAALGRLELGRFAPLPAWDLPLYPLDDATTRCEWERAVCVSGGDPVAEVESKRAVVRWRLHALLARLTGELSEYHEAAVVRPEHAATRAALGCALARGGRLGDALSHLRAAVGADPFDRAAARALAAALADSDEPAGVRRFARQQRWLSAAVADAVPAEEWFTATGPAGDELVSVVIVVHDLPELTRLCLDSVVRHTRPPFEVVVVDNGSGPETADLLGSFTRRPGPARFEVVRSETNQGYPAAANRGLAAAGGEFVTLLNNDTVVTPGWMDRLLDRLLDDWPRVGLVGPVTNAAPDPQRVEVGYTDLDGMPGFAAARRRAHAGEQLTVNRLSGFCLLAHRSVVATVGPLDEQFGTGFFEDDDWCLRVRRAGYVLAVAVDVFVHHFGNATFQALGLDTRRMLTDNFERFRVKWGDAEAAPYRAPGAPATRPTVAACLIVRDEERHLPDCLASVADLVDEVIVVDTGSKDRTKEVAAGFGAKVFDFPWVDSFAAARNEGLRHATADWVLWVDADDRIGPDDRTKLRTLLASLGSAPAAYVMKCRCVSDQPEGGTTVVDHVRLFPNDPRVRWRYRVHEQILPAVREAGIEVRWADVAVTHVGYADPAARGRKLERDLRLLRLEEADQPDEPFVLFNLGSVLLECGRPAEALAYLERSLRRSHPRDSIARKLYALIATCHRHGGREGEALRACTEGRGHYPDDAELLFLDGAIRQGQGDWAAAAGRYRQLLDGAEGVHFASVDDGLRGYKTRHRLAEVCVRLGREAEAEELWRRAAADQPRFRPVWLGIGLLGLARGDRALLEEAAARLEGLGEDGRADARELRSRFEGDTFRGSVYVG